MSALSPTISHTLAPGEATGQAELAPPTYLVIVAGPPRPALELDPQHGTAGLLLGRQEQCDLHLDGAEQVSRRHARFRFEPHAASDRGAWYLSDAGSRWGTWLNGRRLGENDELPLRQGDQIRITPWTLLVSANPVPHGLHIRGADDPAGHVRSLAPEQLAPLQHDRLNLLLTGAAALHDAKDEREMATRLLSLAREGTRLTNGAVLRPLDVDGRFDVLASHMPDAAEGVSFSRSLLDAARGGEVAEVRADNDFDPTSQSIVQMQITRALCVPVLLGEAPAMFLYLDQRGETVLQNVAADQENAAAFCVALSKIASLSLSNLKRVQMERRAAEIDAEINAAAVAQQWILPKRHATAGGFGIVGESRPGRGVGGDFFDVIELGLDKLAVALGDVSGKGVAAGVLMTATQGFLHALLGEAHDPAEAAAQLNRFVHPRRPDNRFITLWFGLFDKAAGTLTYVDAGHGLAVLAHADGHCTELTAGGGVPIGIMPDASYTAHTTRFAPGDSVLVVSDGIVEQPAHGITYEDRDEFGLSRTKEVLCRSLTTPDPVAAVFDAVVKHAGTPRLADDATVVLVRG